MRMLPTLSKGALKKYLDPDSEIPLEKRKELKRYLEMRVSCRDSEKKLKSLLKMTVAPIISVDYQNLIGVVEKELTEAFYRMDAREIKYYKRVPKSNYIDYLSVRELQALKYLRQAMINSIRQETPATLEQCCYSAGKVGSAVREWFIEKYHIAPENVPADEVSYVVCKSSAPKIDKVIKWMETPKQNEVENNPLLYEDYKGQVTMNLDNFFKIK